MKQTEANKEALCDYAINISVLQKHILTGSVTRYEVKWFMKQRRDVLPI
jgi:hypothetical protein